MKYLDVRHCLLIGIILLLCGCAVGSVQTVDSGSKADYEHRVLIASQNSGFKQAVAKEVRDSLKKNSYYVKIIDVKNLRSESPDDYNAIVILNACMAGRPDPRVESFLEILTEKDKIVLLTTGLLDNWKPESAGVDAMTSASAMDQSSAIGQTIVKKIMTIDEK